MYSIGELRPLLEVQQQAEEKLPVSCFLSAEIESKSSLSSSMINTQTTNGFLKNFQRHYQDARAAAITSRLRVNRRDARDNIPVCASGCVWGKVRR